ncbi:MAG: TonB-dependent receptor [Acidobacteria bacterium]|nr:TonB-dependent receptor [Acidobacteriota bacterium]MBI3426417.1 TonB-dependent receptor [Acidobacteriota bacterium]
MKHLAVKLISLAALLALCLSTALHAQEARGTITGRVLDANQAAVPNATVKITNNAMGTTNTLTTNAAGFYQATYLLPGTYRIQAEAKGFKKYLREKVAVQVNDTVEIDVALEIGDVGETVTVTTDAPALETSSGSLGTVVDSRRVAELPIPHGEPFKLIGLAGGVSYTRDPRLDRPFEPTHIVGYSINGTLANRSDITIDGVPSTSTANANEVIASFVPPQDLIQEFKVQTATFDASFGNTEGGVTNLSIKSGTNGFHGTAYWTKLTPGTFANDFFANRTGTPLPNFNYRRLGGTIGGPVWIPKLYNGHNRTFFMYGIENIPEARPRNDGTFTIPSVKMRSGDFSELLAANAGYQLYNPFTARVNGSRIQRDPFVGNVIPANLINPIARKFVDSFLPKPTTTGAADGTGNFAQPGLLENIKYLSNTIRIDHVLNERHRLFGRASWYNRNSDYDDYYQNIATGNTFLFKSRQGALDHVWTINSTMVVNTRYGYNRFIRGTDSNPGNRGMDLTTLGFPAYYNKLIPDDIRRFPRFDFTGYQGTAVGGEFRPTDTHAFNSTMNHVISKHSLKYGMEFRSYRETDKFFGNNQTGQFTFDSTYVRGPLDNAAVPSQLGFSFAALLLGIPTSGSIAQPADYAEQSTTWGVFLQDDWKFSQRLTINAGLRWEYEGALTERYNKSVRDFDYNAAQPIEAAARAAYLKNPTPEVATLNVRGGLNFAGVNGNPRGLYFTPHRNFMPRVGFAYKLTDKMVARGGYGIFFGFLGQRRGDVNQIGFSTSTTLTPSLNNGVSFIETLSNPFQAFQNGLSAPRGAVDGTQTFLGQTISFFNPHPLAPYHQRWELSLQRELPQGWVAEAAYVGNRGTHIETGRNLNTVPLKYLSTATVRDDTQNNYLGALLPNPFVGLMPANAGTAFRAASIARSQLLKPYPEFGDINTTTNEGYSWYHSLQARLDKRFSKGYTLGFNYTWSKFMEAVEFLNAADPDPVETISGSDRPHRFSASGILELPFGKRRKWGANVNRGVSYAISGWQMSGVYQFQSGVPIGFGNVFYFGSLRDIALPGDQQTVAQWFNTKGFVALRNGATVIRNAAGTPVWVDFNDPCKTTYNAASCPGTPLANPTGFNRDGSFQPASNVRTAPLRLGFLRSDQISNIDLSVIKKTELWENRNLEFRAEFINAFNHVLFPGPTTGVTSAAFGQIVASNQANYARRVQLTLKFVF